MYKRIQFLQLLLALLLIIAVPVRAAPIDNFDFDNTGHSWKNAYLLSAVSYYAYRSKIEDADGETYLEKAKNVYEPYGLEVVQIINKRSDTADTQAVILRDDRVIILAFSGSESESASIALKDWILTDARIVMREVDGVRVHSGFYDALAVAYADVKASLMEHAGEREIWVTGHSLGAALAVMAAFMLDSDGIAVRGAFTYAGPRVGDQALAERFEQQLGTRFQRWVVERDPVPRVPPNLSKFPYQPSGVTNIIRGDGDYDLDSENEAGGVPNPASHSMGVYVNYLYRALPENDRKNMPNPPSLCGAGKSDVGAHPETGYPLCKRIGTRKISVADCEDEGGTVTGIWCAFVDEDKYRYRVREIKQ